MTRAVRSGRNAGLVVAVTGAANQIGVAVCRRLLAAEGVRQVVALDAERPGVPGVTFRKADPTDPALSSSLHKVDVLVHLAVSTDSDTDRTDQRRRNTFGAQVALTAAAATPSVKHVIVLSSARVYGAHSDNAVPLDEDAPLRAVAEPSALGDLLEIERLARRSSRAYPHVAVTVLRPALLLGPGLENAAAGLLDGPRLLAVRGAKPHWQFCHVDDLASAVETVIRHRLDGAITVGSEGWLEQAEVEKALGRRRLELPAAVAFGSAARLHAFGVTSGPASELSYLVHPWVVSSKRLREAGWNADYTNAEALATYAAGRPVLPQRMRIGAKGAAVGAGAAGATVALVGTAALIRRARRRKQNRG